MNPLLIRPDPNDVVTGLLPDHRIEGIYVLVREAYNDQVLIIAPPDENGVRDSYLLPFFRCMGVLTQTLKLSPAQAERLLDLLWNFYRYCVDVRDGRIFPFKGDPRDHDAEAEQIIIKKLGLDRDSLDKRWIHADPRRS